ncbi:unnamed protein product [Schistosoma curassoni]|uniref:Uncharacterized protein n=1 Tax=Schistosoma curassoni TaxID=6186 RepID=A0A183JEN6_9TREM|nr:unnamed protein product [Schistosoma curassoni]
MYIYRKLTFHEVQTSIGNINIFREFQTICMIHNIGISID